jgi:hypothetical protein
MRYYPRPGFRVPAAALATAALLVAGVSEGAVPHASHHGATIGNGYGFAVYDGDARKLTMLTEAPHASKSATSATRNPLYDAYFGLRASGGAAWLSETPIEGLESGGLHYVDQSGIVAATQLMGPLRAVTYSFSPFGLASPCVVLALEVTNDSAVPQPDAAAYALLNLHLGAGAPSPDALGESLTFDSAHDAWSETGPSGLTAHYLSLSPSQHHGATPKNPYPIVKDGAR